MITPWLYFIAIYLMRKTVCEIIIKDPSLLTLYAKHNRHAFLKLFCFCLFVSIHSSRVRTLSASSIILYLEGPIVCHQIFDFCSVL